MEEITTQTQDQSINELPIKKIPNNLTPFALMTGLLVGTIFLSIGLWETVGRRIVLPNQDQKNQLPKTQQTAVQQAPEQTPTIINTSAPVEKFDPQLILHPQGISQKYWLIKGGMKATDTHIYLTGYGNEASGITTFLGSPLANGQIANDFSALPSLPENIAATNFIITDTYVYATSLEDTKEGGDFPSYKTPHELFVAKKNTDGSIGAWQHAGYLPKEIPLDNGGYDIVSNGNSLLVIIRPDALTLPVYHANISESGKISEWENIGELPVDWSNALNTSSQFQYQGSQLTYLSKNSLKEYSVGKTLTLQKEQDLKLPNNFDKPYDKPVYFFYHKNKLYFMLEVKQSGDTTLQLWRAKTESTPISFELIQTQTGIGAGEFYFFAHNSNAIFTVIQTGQAYLSTMQHKISVIQLP